MRLQKYIHEQTIGLEPHAACIVNVPGDHANSAARRTRHGRCPQFVRKVLDEVNRDTTAGPPRI